LRIGVEGINERTVPVKKDATQFSERMHPGKGTRKVPALSANIR
jgi:hypothetical protein